MVGKQIGRMVVLVGAFLAMFVGSGNAATISVKQLGCGTEADCYTTIANGILYASDGDTVKVYPGTYSESITINKSIALQGSGPQWTTIYGTSAAITVNNIVTTTISGFTIRSASGSGVYIYMGTSLNVKIKNNYIVSNGKYGIETDGNSNGAISIINNVISYNANTGVYILAYNGHTAGVINNIISNNGAYGMYIYAGRGSTSYNDVYSNTSGGYSSIIAGTGDIAQNPLFIDSTNGNYALQGTSTCKNTGSPGLADNDPDGTRNDMGAFGGPGAAAFWPYPSGAPIITILNASPTSVQKGATITIDATGEVK